MLKLGASVSLGFGPIALVFVILFTFLLLVGTGYLLPGLSFLKRISCPQTSAPDLLFDLVRANQISDRGCSLHCSQLMSGLSNISAVKICQVISPKLH